MEEALLDLLTANDRADMNKSWLLALSLYMESDSIVLNLPVGFGRSGDTLQR